MFLIIRSIPSLKASGFLLVLIPVRLKYIICTHQYFSFNILFPAHLTPIVYNIISIRHTGTRDFVSGVGPGTLSLEPCKREPRPGTRDPSCGTRDSRRKIYFTDQM